MTHSDTEGTLTTYNNSFSYNVAFHQSSVPWSCFNFFCARRWMFSFSSSMARGLRCGGARYTQTRGEQNLGGLEPRIFLLWASLYGWYILKCKTELIIPLINMCPSCTTDHGCVGELDTRPSLTLAAEKKWIISCGPWSVSPTGRYNDREVSNPFDAKAPSENWIFLLIHKSFFICKASFCSFHNTCN